jgi:DNA repair protein SbcC/Rad50
MIQKKQLILGGIVLGVIILIAAGIGISKASITGNAVSIEDYQALQAETEGYQDKIITLEAMDTSLSKQIGQLKTEITGLREAIRNVELDSESNNECDDLENDKDEKQEDIDDKEQEIEDKEQDIDDKEEEISDAEDANEDTSELEDDLDDLNNELDDLKSELSDLQDDLDQIEEDIDDENC